MDVRTQDAVERLQRDNDFKIYNEYVESRRQVYYEELANYDPSDIARMARTQGYIHALAEVLRIPEDAKTEKDARTS